MKRRIVACLLLSGFIISVHAVTAAAAAKDFKQPDAYAVVIGISEYREEVIPKVSYAVRDAEAVAELLQTQAGIPKSHIRLLTDSKATGNDLRTIGHWLKMRVKADSTVYLYYAGHGTPNPKTGEAYLVPWDGHPDYPTGLYPLKDLYESLDQLPANNVIVMLDSCFSGSPGRSVLAKGARPMVISVENPLLAAGKVVVLAAATGNQISSDYEKTGHGLFTHYLLTGLRGEADANKDQVVTLQEVVPYVREHVTHVAVDELNREQTPVVLPGPESLGARNGLMLARALSPPERRAIEAKELSKRRAEKQAMPEEGERIQTQERDRQRQAEEQVKRDREAEEQRLARAKADSEAEQERHKLDQERLKIERERLELERQRLADERARRDQESKVIEEARARQYETPRNPYQSLSGGKWCKLLPAAKNPDGHTCDDKVKVKVVISGDQIRIDAYGIWWGQDPDKDPPETFQGTIQGNKIINLSWRLFHNSYPHTGQFMEGKDGRSGIFIADGLFFMKLEPISNH